MKFAKIAGKAILINYNTLKLLLVQPCTNLRTLLPSTLRLLENAAEELARLDELCAVAPSSFSRALCTDLTARLADSIRRVDTQATTPGADSLGSAAAIAAGASVGIGPSSPWDEINARSTLIAAGVDAVHVAACPPHLMQLHEIVTLEERRARSGAPLTIPRLLEHQTVLGVVHALDAEALAEALRPGGQPRPVLLRAIAASVACGEGPMTQLVPALLLCSAGLTDQLRLLPFDGVEREARATAIQAWREGEPEPMTALLLDDCARAARQRRLAIRRELKNIDTDEAALAPLGRAAITARRALAVLRESLATSVPQLSPQLDCSRPAAGDALERLVEVGLAVEITGRQRDRVFACARAIAMLG